MKILGLIPARGESKGVPGKNLRTLAGRPLLSWAAEAARTSAVLDRIVLSTEDDEIARLGVSVGLEVPFRRPPALATDESPMIDVVIHALEELGKDGYIPDAVALLQPTSPLRRPVHISKARDLLGEADSVCSVVPLPLELCPHYVMKIEDGYLRFFLAEGDSFIRRQDVPPAYSRDGTIYLTRRDVILRNGNFYGDCCIPLVVDEEESLSIDDERDWAEAERRLTSRMGG